MYFYRHGKVKKFCVNFLQANNKKKLLAFMQLNIDLYLYQPMVIEVHISSK